MPKILKTSLDSTLPASFERAEIKTFVESYDNFLFDCDGVLWLGSEVIPGIPATLDWLRSMGKRVFFVTNNSTKSRQQYAEKFSKLGIHASPEEIFSSAYAAAVYIKEVAQLPKDKKVFVIGMDGIRNELDNIGIENFSLQDDKPLFEDSDLLQYKPDDQVGAVVVGLDRNISYRKYAQAYQYLRYNNGGKGALFVATNADSTFPMSGTMYPGTGAILAPLITALDREPIVTGKPSLNMLEAVFAQHKINPSRTCMVGDRLNTDIQFGLQGGIGTLLVLTGVNQLKDLEGSSIQPSFIIPGLVNLSEAKD
ncbi:hypothetical protein DSO57_1038609 [Entomophthora muscae]|uniref:Uncharacterized protein n=1 Tax=Entomophthora muscae TaxID=34485 RepID=A0ACC2RDE0_9FUNG|nr:hypothetical protein DSO57_1038609 [Entomophthora muscae]